MPGQRLYVIGNGFDLHHKINSSYSQSGWYLKQADAELHQTIENYLPFEGDWSDLEATLPIWMWILLSMMLHSYGVDDWSDSYHDDYQYEVQRIVSALSDDLKTAFTAWVETLKIPDRSTCSVPLLPLNASSRYLNFNYTNMLQQLYGIPKKQVLHIHNAIADEPANLILGHAFNPSSRKSLNHGHDLEDQDTRITQANEILDSYFSATYKPTGEVIDKHRGYFDSLSGTDKIFVVGHSLADVDMPYFAEIVSATKASNPAWVVTYYKDSEISEKTRALSRAGVPNNRISFVDTPNLPA